MKNKSLKYVYIYGACTIIGLILFIISTKLIFSWHSDNFLFWIASIIFLILSITLFTCFFYLTYITSKIMNGSYPLLAHWIYKDEEWEVFLKERLAEIDKEKKSFFKKCLIVFFTTVIGFIVSFIILNTNIINITSNNRNTIYFIMCVLGIVDIVIPYIFISYILWYNKLKNHKPGEVYITIKGLYYNYTLLLWDKYRRYRRRRPYTVIESVHIIYENDYQIIYIITDKMFNSDIKILVPKGEEKKASKVVDELTKISKEYWLKWRA